MDVALAETGMVAARAATETVPMNSRREGRFEIMSWLAWFEWREFERQNANAVTILYNIYAARETTLAKHSIPRPPVSAHYLQSTPF